jgi:hypothetical protein
MGGASAESLPLRPQTTGELLDAATNLLRRNARPLIGAGLVLALVEQLALYPLRRAALAHPPWYLPSASDSLGRYWLLIAVGFGTETVVVTLLGGLAARASVADLTGAAPPRPLGPGSRPVALALLALLLGAGATLASLAGLAPAVAFYAMGGAFSATAMYLLTGVLPAVVWYLLAGLAAPALVVDRRAPAAAPRPAGAQAPGARAVWPQPAGPRPTGPITATGPLPTGVLAATGPLAGARFTAIGPLRAVRRAVALFRYGGGRPGGIRLVGYLAWWLIRIGLGSGSIALLSVLVSEAGTGWVWLAAGAAWAIVNAIAYPALGCLDAVVHLENRMRVEGLDIALSRALRQHRPTEPALAVPR